MACVNAFGASYYVDYSSGADGNSGTSTSSPWKHCPGDSAATGTAGSTLLNFGDTVYFKGGVQYVLVGDGNPIYQTGIALNWSGSASNPITYDGNSAGAWGTGRAIFTDNYSSNFIAAFYVYGAVSNLVFNNLEIGPMGGSAALPADPGTGVPSQNGYGIFVNGMARGVTVENCYFHNLGYTYNTIPMDGESVASSDSRDCSSGVEVHGAIGLVVTNCEFTHVHTGIEFGWNQDSSNVTFVANYLHDFMVWGIDFGAIQGNLDYLSVNGNTFSGMGWAYSPPYWSGYENKPATCPTCFVGPPHQDPIFFRTGNTNVTCGAHNNIYNNIFQTTHTAEVFTADIYLEYAPSVNIYNNLFDNPNAGLAFSGQSVCGNSTGILTTNSWSGGGAPPVTISYELNQGGTIRILNNTIIINTTNASESSALLVGACGCLVPPLTWPTNAFLQIENNLAYSFYNQGFDATVVLFGVVTNQYPVAQWTVDYNDWHSQNTADTWFWWNNQPGFNIHGGLAADQSVGFDAHGMTNDPAFVSLAYGSSVNSVQNDYHLQSSSTVIGAGANLSSLNLPGLNADKDGNPRPSLGSWDMGAYEYNTNSVPPSRPVAAFSAAPTIGTVPLTVTFTDTSTSSITNRLWHFGDGTWTNTLSTTMVHQYTTAGTNSVRLNVYGPGGGSVDLQTKLIVVSATGGDTNGVSAPVASFGATPTNGTAPLTVTFTDLSTGTITNRVWQFGDGNVTNTTATTVIYQYTGAGTDTVQLVVSGPGGSSTNVQANLVTVSSTGGDTNSVPPPVAAFSAAPTNGTAPLMVTFTDTSTGSITNRLWYFGDGSSINTSSTTVVHQYTTAGTNSVQLVVSGPGGTSVDVQGNLVVVKSSSQSGGGTNGVAQVGAHYHWRFLAAH